MMTTYNETSVCDYCSHTLVFLTAKKSDRGHLFSEVPYPATRKIAKAPAKRSVPLRYFNAKGYCHA